jgi:hypothetical protein
VYRHYIWRQLAKLIITCRCEVTVLAGRLYLPIHEAVLVHHLDLLKEYGSDGLYIEQFIKPLEQEVSQP